MRQKLLIPILILLVGVLSLLWLPPYMFHAHLFDPTIEDETASVVSFVDVIVCLLAWKPGNRSYFLPFFCAFLLSTTVVNY